MQGVCLSVVVLGSLGLGFLLSELRWIEKRLRILKKVLNVTETSGIQAAFTYLVESLK